MVRKYVEVEVDVEGEPEDFSDEELINELRTRGYEVTVDSNRPKWGSAAECQLAYERHMAQQRKGASHGNYNAEGHTSRPGDQAGNRTV